MGNVPFVPEHPFMSQRVRSQLLEHCHAQLRPLVGGRRGGIGGGRVQICRHLCKCARDVEVSQAVERTLIM